MSLLPNSPRFSSHKSTIPTLFSPNSLCFAVSRIRKALLLLTDDASSGNVFNVNAINIGMEIERTLLGAGARRARDLTNDDDSNKNKTRFKPKCETLINAYSALLVTTTIIATTTYQAVLSARAATFNSIYKVMSTQDSIMTSSFLMLNSVGFIASVAMIIYLLHEFPLKPWPQILILTMFGSYMCLIMAISPHEALALLLSIPFLLLAAAGKMYGFPRQSSNPSS